jgi:mannose-6-phosphate isomerase-like protein (cupin superfamily)
MSGSIEPFAVGAEDGGQLISPTGAQVRIMARTPETGGALTVMEIVSPAKDGPAVHVHSREDEIWYVLEGEYRFRAGDAKFRVSAGGMAFGPRGVPHGFQNVGDEPGKLLIITTPSGLERFFEDFDALLPGRLDPDALATVGAASGITFVGPPLAVSDPL